MYTDYSTFSSLLKRDIICNESFV